VRLFPRVVARAALIAAFASVVAPGFVGSRSPSAPGVIDQSAFLPVELMRPGATTTAPLLDPLQQSNGTLTGATVFDEQLAIAAVDPTVRAAIAQRPAPVVRLIPLPAPPKRATPASSGGTPSTTSGSSGGATSSGGGSTAGTWTYAAEVSWYGPGFYGHRTACGQTLTSTLMGVANRTLPCGTRVSFKYNGKVITVPVVDRGPYVSGRSWDLTAGACAALAHCFTASIYYRIE